MLSIEQALTPKPVNRAVQQLKMKKNKKQYRDKTNAFYSTRQVLKQAEECWASYGRGRSV